MVVTRPHMAPLRTKPVFFSVLILLEGEGKDIARDG